LESDAVEHAGRSFVNTRRSISSPRFGIERLHHDCTQRGKVDIGAEFVAVTSGA
jgi:hypothetical protein